MKKEKAYKFSVSELKEDLFREARALRIHGGFAEQIVEKVLKKVNAYRKTHPVVTKKDIDLLVYRELKKYHEDLAFIYKNRGKII